MPKQDEECPIQLESTEISRFFLPDLDQRAGRLGVAETQRVNLFDVRIQRLAGGNFEGLRVQHRLLRAVPGLDADEYQRRNDLREADDLGQIHPLLTIHRPLPNDVSFES